MECAAEQVGGPCVQRRPTGGSGSWGLSRWPGPGHAPRGQSTRTGPPNQLSRPGSQSREKYPGSARHTGNIRSEIIPECRRHTEGSPDAEYALWPRHWDHKPTGQPRQTLLRPSGQM
eukprot:13200741-Alexandrium_andersonii.AAC.1